MAIRIGTQRASSLTLRITRPPTPRLEDDKQRVAGHVHALVRPRCHVVETRSA